MSGTRDETPAGGREDTHTKPTGDDPARGPVAFSVLVSCEAGVFSRTIPNESEVVLGRGEQSQIVIDDSSVSRRHATLHLQGDLEVADLGSTNGTRVNGVRIAPGARAAIDVGAVLELGSALVVLQRGKAAMPVTSPSDAILVRSASTAVPARFPPPVTGPLRESPVAEDPAMKRLYGLVAIVAPSPLSLLLLGETGVGKDVFAETIHRSSPRADQPFLSINCAALPDGVLDGELFGYEKGAFSGAVQARPGLFEAATGGTLFLDEIGELPATTQAKLLRVLESGEVMRLGSRKATHIDVRIVAATNRDLRAMIARDTFRSDLFFRLNGMTITIPPLRQRPAEIAVLARLFLERTCAKMGKPALQLSPHALKALEAFAWPGNVRELRNVLERAATLCQSSRLGSGDLRMAAPEIFSEAGEVEAPSLVPAIGPADEPPGGEDGTSTGGLRHDVDAFERERIVRALAQASGNQKRAAEALGISRRTMLNKLDAHGIGRPRKKGDG